ncbi:serine protease [Lyophyllum atratum]|nr:serine protease [Lyophyllum atratum]
MSKNPIPGRYIVKLKSADGQRRASPAFSGITHRWEGWNGFAGNFSSERVEQLLASPDVDYIEEDGIMSIMSGSRYEARSPTVLAMQTDATWGLARISQDAKLTNQNTGALFTYNYGTQAGRGVDIYVVDTGVYIQHSDFGGRAGVGATFGGYANADGNGHGTHCAATAAGTKYGVAKLASIISVKVLGDQGSGAISDIISGINWVVTSSANSGRPSVILAPFGGSASTALDSAVLNATNAVPGRVASAITVGASTIADAVSSSSNTGSVIDLFAPGQNVLSAWIGSPTASAILSGGSSAASHVAGLAAYLLSVIGDNNLETALVTISVKNALTGIPAGTGNRLASNNVTRLGITI